MIMVRVLTGKDSYDLFVNSDLIETVCKSFNGNTRFRIGGISYDTPEGIASLVYRISNKYMTIEESHEG